MIFSHKPTLRGERVTLRPVHADDADVLDEIIRKDPEVAILTGTVHSRDEPVTNPPIETMREIYRRWSTADDRLVLAVTAGDNSVLGEVVLNDWDKENRSCGFRTLIGQAGRGRGLGTEATRLIVAYGLQELGLHRITLQVYAFNPRARHVYEKVGFRLEGTGRDALRFDGDWIDVHYMAALATDPEWAVEESAAVPVPSDHRRRAPR
ncbi:GNAT family N-acetyltransferase [Nocardia speluncae]|uniref:GNAT family N-acetyltransferase n=2 Tax=Nocardia speluncae TaxID=419477 RepID=A0A846XMB2_9NOCA|nr:GNAT family N-acetyltransferase [Nocardia speluncae]